MSALKLRYFALTTYQSAACYSRLVRNKSVFVIQGGAERGSSAHIKCTSEKTYFNPIR